MSNILIGVCCVVELENFIAKIEFRDNLFKTLHLPLSYLAHGSTFQFILLLLSEFQSNSLSNVMYLHN